MKMRFLIIIFSGLCSADLAFAAPSASKTMAGGAPPSTSPEDAGRKGLTACGPDIERWCLDVEPGKGRIGRRLFEHLEELSEPCLRYARHGGPGHEMESLMEIDRTYETAPLP